MLNQLWNKQKNKMDERTPPESRHATALRGARSRLRRIFYPYSFSKYIKVFSTPALEQTRYCAKVEPEVICDVRCLFLMSAFNSYNK